LYGGGDQREGLILTNHHCGFSAIQEQSSLEHDYLKNGFWAADGKSELKNARASPPPSSLRMEDVTDQILAARGPEGHGGATAEAVAESLGQV
jgi:hypothetical protein